MKKGALVGLFFLAWQPQSFAMNLQDYLKAVETRNKSLQAFDASTAAAESRKEAGDIELVPMLSADAQWISDKAPLSQFALIGATESKSAQYSLGLAKKFSSGTSVALSAMAAEFDNVGAPGVYQKFGVGSLGVELSQSLWRDFFGNATRLRRQREDAATSAETGSFDLQKKAVLVGAEAAYWDYVYASENLKVGKASLERAKRIESWTRRRVNDGISDRADLLQAQALVSTRQLLLISTEDELAAAKRKVRDYLELADSEEFPEITGDINQSRALSSMITGKKGKVVAIEAYLASLQAKARSLAAREVEDAYRPDLILGGSYKTNSLEGDMNTAVGQWTDMDRPTAKVGLSFRYLFDTDVKSSAQEAARAEALAARLQSERKMLESDSAWTELNRRYIELNKRIEAAAETSRLQTAAAKAQTDLFNKGRSITMNVINAEEDAGVAELNLIRLKSEQRKMEAQGRLFVAIEEQ
ncbi:TolC family protein [Bdellovibrio bacteriovorus]|uniref:TolC family protein n=1 Tax=Bdellovibrio bacteriovorus TaxID=959 RepID=UPI0035A6CBAB